MLTRILAVIGFALMTTASVAQQAPSGYSNDCDALALTFGRTMLVCGRMPSAQSVAIALRAGTSRIGSPRMIGQSYRIPPWEITGVQSAGYDSSTRYRPAVQVVLIGHRRFAVYSRGDSAILIERRR